MREGWFVSAEIGSCHRHQSNVHHFFSFIFVFCLASICLFMATEGKFLHYAIHCQLYSDKSVYLFRSWSPLTVIHLFICIYQPIDSLVLFIGTPLHTLFRSKMEQLQYNNWVRLLYDFTCHLEPLISYCKGFMSEGNSPVLEVQRKVKDMNTKWDMYLST